MTIRRTLSLALFCLVTACGSDDPSVDGQKDGSDGAGSATDQDAVSGDGTGGDSGGLQTVFGGDRPVELQVPGDYDDGAPTPLLIGLHGYSASAEIQDAYMNLPLLAKQQGMLYASPNGSAETGGNAFWNASDACCDFYDSGVDDSAYLRALIEEIQAKYNVDPARIYLLGHSNGGFMAYRMACDHADLIAGVASLAGAVYADTSFCKPSEPVSVLQIHGTADSTVNYVGGAMFGKSFPGAEDTVSYWGKVAGCDESWPAASGTIDLDRALTGKETEVHRMQGCAAGVGVELWAMQAGQHVPQISEHFVPALLEFLLAHPKE